MYESIDKGEFSISFFRKILDVSKNITLDYERKVLDVLSSFPYRDRVCVLASGSFGKYKMTPYSDIDLIFIVDDIDDKISEEISNVISKIWNFSELGHSVRTIDDTVSLIVRDVKVFSSLCDSRFLWGNMGIYLKLRRKLKEIISISSHGILSQLISDREIRGARNKSFIEPNLRDSLGGIRDIDFIRYIKILFKNYVRSSDFLVIYGIRFVLHLISKRKNDKIYVELQEDLSRFFGLDFRDFMRRVLISMHRIKVLADISENFGRLNFCEDAPKKIIFKNYISYGEFFEPIDFSSVDVVEIFRVFKETGLRINPRIMLRILKGGGKITENSYQNFVDIISSPPRIAQSLSLMHDLGVIQRLFSDFKRVYMLYQVYPPHIYPVDLHLIECVSEVEKLLLGNLPPYVNFVPNCDTKILVLSALFHDIGKGRKNHSHEGAKIVKKILVNMGIRGDELKSVVFLVRNHLLISETLRSIDLHDEEVIFRFSRKFPSQNLLDMLFVLTIADALSTNPNTWNSWRATLITELYLKVSERIRLGFLPSRREDFRSYLMVDFKGVFPEEDIKEVLRGLSDKFFTFEYDKVMRYVFSFLKSLRSDEPYVSYVVRGEGVLEFLTVWWDKLGHFSECAGAFYVSGFNILSAHAEADIMGKAMNIFWVEPVSFEKAEKFSRIFKDVCKGNVNIEDLVLKRKIQEMRYFSFSSDVKVILDNKLSKNFSIIEVYCDDRPGLLYDITRAFMELGLDISVAKISTDGKKVFDIFYVLRRINGERRKIRDDEWDFIRRTIEISITQTLPLHLLRQ